MIRDVERQAHDKPSRFLYDHQLHPLYPLPSSLSTTPRTLSTLSLVPRRRLGRDVAAVDITHPHGGGPNPSDDAIVTCLGQRFLSDTIYTSIGSSGLVALNPHKYVPASGDAVLRKYAAEYRDTSEDKQPLPPHIFQLANNAYSHMRRTAQDQSMLLETGSSKSENYRLAIETILEFNVSNLGKKGSKLATQVPASEFVPETFAHARTLFNPNASSVGKYTELQFSDRGRLHGVKTLDDLLERNRVAGAPNGERNFHILYYLVAGASPEERLHLLDKPKYRYFGQHRAAPAPNARPNDDAMRFE
ncbi:Glycosyltransferase family 2 protein [Mycena kentingensis (nom. inval.)]|nr:Glycosyltransferase family 2 protein [Mycena kentingensis (nom. inval.)]